MFRTLTAVALIALTSVPVNADFRTVNRAYEAQLSGIQLPATPNGTIAFRQCGDCDLVSLSVTPRTRYVINNSDVDLPEFRRLLMQVLERRGKAVIVQHDLESNVVTAVSVRL